MMSHAALDLGRVEVTTLPGGHGGSHFTRSHAFEGLGHVTFGVILGITTLKVGNDAVEGPAFNRQVRRLVDLVGDGFAPLPPMVIVFICGMRREIVHKEETFRWNVAWKDIMRSAPAQCASRSNSMTMSCKITTFRLLWTYLPSYSPLISGWVISKRK